MEVKKWHWRTSELDYIKANYFLPNRELAKFLGRSKGAVEMAKYGLKKQGFTPVFKEKKQPRKANEIFEWAFKKLKKV